MLLKFQPNVNAQSAIDNALHRANQRANGNLAFKRCDRDGNTRQGGEKWQITLTVRDSKGACATIKPTHSGTGKGYRRVAAACWHGYGYFIEALPTGTVVQSSPMIIGLGKRNIVVGKDNVWIDYNVGSRYSPLMASEACNCNGLYD